jgi:hypothetical protein
VAGWVIVLILILTVAFAGLFLLTSLLDPA